MSRTFICPTCNKELPYDLSRIVEHTEQDIVDLIKKDHPEWSSSDGTCKICYRYYRRMLHPDQKDSKEI